MRSSRRWLESLSPWPEEFGLGRMHAMLAELGHPERAFVLCLAGGGYGVQPELEPTPEPIAFDCGHDVYDFKPAWTRVRPATAIRAAHEYVRTGRLPACLTFDPDA